MNQRRGRRPSQGYSRQRYRGEMEPDMYYYRNTPPPKKKHHFFWWCMPVLLVAAFLVIVGYSDCSIIQRVKYEFSGGIEEWEDAAASENIVPTIEEYYYDHLPEELREAYREIYVRVMRNEDKADFLSKVTVDEFWKVYYAMLADHPEIFWIGTSAQVEESGLSGKVVAYNLDVTVPVERRAAMKAELEAAADDCIAQIGADLSDYQKLKKVYEYIIDTTEYDGNSADSQNIQSVLLGKASVCAGYSKTFQYILNRMGLFCTYITGTIRDGGEHGWNMVRLDGEYYFVDVTWGDPVFANRVESASTGNVMNYNYLCCTEDDLFKTHVPSDAVELPSCTSDAYNYYKQNGYYYETFDYDTIHSALMNSVWNDESSIVMKFGNREAYETAVYELFENDMLSEPGEYLMDINGVNSWNYRYHTDDNFYLITLYWK